MIFIIISTHYDSTMRRGNDVWFIILNLNSDIARFINYLKDTAMLLSKCSLYGPIHEKCYLSYMCNVTLYACMRGCSVGLEVE